MYRKLSLGLRGRPAGGSGGPLGGRLDDEPERRSLIITSITVIITLSITIIITINYHYNYYY